MQHSVLHERESPPGVLGLLLWPSLCYAHVGWDGAHPWVTQTGAPPGLYPFWDLDFQDTV